MLIVFLAFDIFHTMNTSLLVKKSLSVPVIFLLFFGSGVCGLMYQVIWVRMFGLVFGNTLFASSTVLTAFMAGLAIGSFFAGKYLSQRNDVLRLYAFMELFIGICGFLMPLAITAMSTMYALIYQSFHPSFELLTIIRFCLSFGLCVLPCTFMGATLPLLSRYIAEGHSRKEEVPGKLYGINTVGAVFGCFAAGFILIKAVGIAQTGIIAAIVNSIVAVAAYILFKKDAENLPDKRNSLITANGGTRISLPEKIVITSCALSGFAALALEIAWTKALARTFQMVWSLQMDSYAFVAMLAVLLAGIGVGSYLISMIIHRIKKHSRVLYGVQFLLGVSIIASIAVIQHPIYFRDGLNSFVNMPFISGVTLFFVKFLGAQALMQIVLAAAMIFIPAVLMGIAFPLFAVLCLHVTGNIGRSVGTIYSANTVGGILGSLVAGFVLIPAIGLLPTIALSACFYFITSLAVLFIASETGIVRWVTAAVIAGLVLAALHATDFNYSHFFLSAMQSPSPGNDEKIIFFKEHADGAILVKESNRSGKEMLNDGVIVAAAAGPNLFSHIFPAHLVSLLSNGLRDMLVIGSGCGVTSGSMLLYDEVTRLDAVEINSGIIGPAKRYFSDANNNAFSNTKLNLIIQDGKNFIKMTDKSYDVIYSSPSLPQANQGSAGLFTREFFEDCKKKLKKGGLQCLWIPLHMYQPEEFLIIMKTFIAVYQHVSLWHPPQTELSTGLAYLIGSDAAVDPDYRMIAEKLNRPGIIRDILRLEDGGFRTPEEFIAMFSMGGKKLRNMTADITSINTDNHPVVEFYKRTGDLMQSAIMSKIKLIELLGKNSEDPYPYIKNIPDGCRDTVKNQLARLYEGNQYLMMGHAARTYREFLSAVGSCPPEIDARINHYYSLAFTLMPENLFLRNYFTQER